MRVLTQPLSHSYLTGLHQLTLREWQVLLFLADDYDNKYIAAKLNAVVGVISNNLFL